jgi:mono/diheme cytochrome c family protein
MHRMKSSVALVVTLSLFGLIALAPVPLQNKLQASIDRGKKVYTDRCLTCHQLDGSGVPGMNPPLIKTKWILGEKTALITIVLKGLNTGVQIDGMEYHNVMASQADLNDLQIADALTYVRNSFGNKARLVTEAEVKTVRAKLH